MYRLTIENEQHVVVFSADYADRREAFRTLFVRCADCRCQALSEDATDFELARWNRVHWRTAGHATIIHVQ